MGPCYWSKQYLFAEIVWKGLEGNTFVLVNQHDVTDRKPGMHNVVKTLYLYNIGHFYARDVKVMLRRL